MFDLFKGYKLKFLGLAWSALSALDGFLGINILNSVDASNVVDNIIFGLGVFAGRDALETLFDKISAEMRSR